MTSTPTLQAASRFPPWWFETGVLLSAFYSLLAFSELKLGKSDDEQAGESYKPFHCRICGYGPCMSAQLPRL